MKKYIIIGAGALVLILAVLALVLSRGGGGVSPSLTAPKELVWWGVVDDSSNFSKIISSYKSNHPNISITYKKLREDEYEDALIHAWATDQGPDIFSIPHNAVREYQDFIEPMPKETKMAFYATVKKLGIKEEIEVTPKIIPSLTTFQLQENYVDCVYSDVVVRVKNKEQIMALPFTVDTLALLYNKDHFSQAGIPVPPQDYTELLEDVAKLSRFDVQDNIIQSGIALGRGDNIDQASDILTLIILQSGATMAEGNNVTFTHSITREGEEPYKAGEEALNFYTSFSNPDKESYSWNEAMPSSIEAFANGDVSMILAYHYQLPIINQLSAGRVDYGITRIPFHNKEVNIAKYWVYAVAKKSEYPDVAWNFLQYATSKDNVVQYLNKTSKPAALKTFIEEQAADPILSSFARQTLVAESWYHGKDRKLMENYLTEMIDNVADNSMDAKQAMDLARDRIQQTY